MRTLQIVFCILACLCVTAAAIVGAFLRDLTVVLCLLLAAVLFGVLMFIARARANDRAERTAEKDRPDFMNTPAQTPSDKDKS